MIKKLACLILLLSLISSIAIGQTKFGYIDYEKVVVTIPQYESGKRRIEQKTMQIEDSLSSFGKELMITLRHNHFPSGFKDSVYTKKLEDTLNQLQRKIQLYQENGLLELKNLQEAIDTDLRTIVTQELKRFSFENDLICVADSKAILYCLDCIDFTDEFIDYYKMETWKR